MLLESTLRGLLGDGWTSGQHLEALDTVGVHHETLHNPPAEQPAAVPGSTSGCPTPRKMSDFGMGQQRSGVRVGLRPSHSGADGSVTSPQPGRRERNLRGVIPDIALWTELYESESLTSLRGHFETFTQWCHSAHLLPFLQRCYRRCGVAGLLPNQNSGGHRYSMDPGHPLILPTVNDFCYGHPYPLYRVLQYFYGGMEHLMCSLDNPQVVEDEKATLALMPGQDRLNNQCWFQAPEAPVTGVAQDSQEVALTAKLLKSLEFQGSAPRIPGLADGGNPQRSGTIGSNLGTMPRVNSSTLKYTQKGTVKVLAKHLVSPVAKMSRRAAKAAVKEARRARGSKVGELMPDDPFFWFCHQNYAIFTYPASDVPRSILNDSEMLTHRYSDFMSRTGTPEPGVEEAERAGKCVGFTKPTPSSICLCQHTELSSHVRNRWEVKKEYADENNLILGDIGWYPGALGHRFTYEAKTGNAERYVWMNLVPEAQVLYLEYINVPRKTREGASRLLSKTDPFEADPTSSSSSEEDLDAPLLRRNFKHLRRKRRDHQWTTRTWNSSHTANDTEPLPSDETMSVMLPPLLPVKVT